MATKHLLYDPQASKNFKLLYKIGDMLYTTRGLELVYDPENSIDQSTYTEITSFIVIYGISTHAVFIKTKTQWAICTLNNNGEPETKFGSFDPWNCPENLDKDVEQDKFYHEPIEFVEALRIPDTTYRGDKCIYYPSANVKPFPLQPYLNLKTLTKQGKTISDVPEEDETNFSMSPTSECITNLK